MHVIKKIDFSRKKKKKEKKKSKPVPQMTRCATFFVDALKFLHHAVQRYTPENISKIPNYAVRHTVFADVTILTRHDDNNVAT